MTKIKNPNEIVDPFVMDYHNVFGELMESIFMYGSAVTHEYIPGVSDINIAILVKDNSIPQLAQCLHLQKKWKKKSVSTPFFMTRAYINSSLDTYPIEFLDMQSNYRVLFGEDILKNIQIEKKYLRIQCERELKGIAIHLRRSFVQSSGNMKYLLSLLNDSLRRLFPVFKALLVLKNLSIPKLKSDIVASVEDSYALSTSSFSVIYNNSSQRSANNHYETLFDRYTNDIDRIISMVEND